MTIWLNMQTTSGIERRFPIRSKRTTLGSSMRCALRIPLPCIAPEHCELILDRNNLSLVHLCPERETSVNGTPISTINLKDQDSLTVGPVNFTISFTPPVQPPNHPPAHSPQIADSEIEVLTPASHTANPLASSRLNPD